METFDTLEQISELRKQLDKLEKLAIQLETKKRLSKDNVIDKLCLITFLTHNKPIPLGTPLGRRPDMFDYEIVCRWETDKEDSYTPSFNSNEEGV